MFLQGRHSLTHLVDNSGTVVHRYSSIRIGELALDREARGGNGRSEPTARGLRSGAILL